MLSILGDQSKFLQDVSSNINVRKLESRVKSNLLKLLKMNVINNEEFKILKPSGSVLPNLYGLPKIHKPNIPLRPILSMRGSPTHELAKWLVKLLNPIRTNLCKFSLKDTFELIDFLGDINIKDKSLHSFDVNSLFTNVPLTKTVDFLCDYISKNFPLFPIPLPFLKELLLLCTANVQFTFDGEYFRQVDGVAMGSPLGPLLAEVFMSYVENMTSDLIGETTLYRRYMDDILIICDKDFDVYRLLDKLNGVQNDIVMTHESESNGQLAFLDILLSRRDDGTIRRSVYRKPTWTGQYLNFHSFCPLQYKRGLVKCLFKRTRRICTSDMVENDEKLLTDTLIANGYPLKFINRCKSQLMPRPLIYSVPKKKVYINLPYRGESNSIVLRQRLKAAIENTYCAAQLVVIEKSKAMIPNRPKQCTNDYVTSHCIYQFTCLCGHTYIGRSNRTMQSRVNEHVPRWLQNQCVSNDPINVGGRKPSSSIAKHIIETGHKININTAFRTLYRNCHGQIIKSIEVLAIRKFKPPLCVQKQFVVTLNLPW
ncbi:unnamed protein product [Schistosoma haematobium]|nr:unnamed protein product [Schistosoma haematobium]